MSYEDKVERLLEKVAVVDRLRALGRLARLQASDPGNLSTNLTPWHKTLASGRATPIQKARKLKQIRQGTQDDLQDVLMNRHMNRKLKESLVRVSPELTGGETSLVSNIRPLSSRPQLLSPNAPTRLVTRNPKRLAENYYNDQYLRTVGTPKAWFGRTDKGVEYPISYPFTSRKRNRVYDVKQNEIANSFDLSDYQYRQLLKRYHKNAPSRYVEPGVYPSDYRGDYWYRPYRDIS